MKKHLCLAAWGALALAGSLQARTWTSADGSKSFEGELKSFNPATGEVKVARPDGSITIFRQNILSAADREFLAANKPAAEPAPATKSTASASALSGASGLESTKIGQLAAKAKLQKLDGKRFRRAEMTKTPDYYILYFSASW